ncbi:MAG TPA: hypothetical protein VJI46_00955 [Candidatus Nanoarchaeia archaeon]|nr:hypothetical protein [Candidatus Nanoarchaeia archaeon]
MEENAYTNKELAQDYFSVVAQYSQDLWTYGFQKRKIAGLDIDLPAFYREHGSLDELKVKGIGKKTKGILELILEKGVEEAKKLVQEEKIDELRSSQFLGIPRRDRSE